MGVDLCFTLAKKIFAATVLEPTRGHFVSFKCTPERFAELIEIEGITPAAYMARNHWVTLASGHVLRDAEIKQLIRESYGLVLAKLPERTQAALSSETELEVSKHRPPKKNKRSSPR